MKPINLLVFFASTTLAACQNSPKAADTSPKLPSTYTFKLTQDSTFIGAWGGMLHDAQTGYWPSLTKSFRLIFIYSKNNKIYVSREPEWFDTTTSREINALHQMVTEYDWHTWEEGFDTTFKMESDRVISKQEEEYSKDVYEIDKFNNLIFYYQSLTKSTDNKLEYFKFKPYYFKTLKNPPINK
jgi:hypothetical protein